MAKSSQAECRGQIFCRDKQKRGIFSLHLNFAESIDFLFAGVPNLKEIRCWAVANCVKGN